MLLVKMAAEESRMAGLSLHRKLSISVGPTSKIGKSRRQCYFWDEALGY